MTPQRNNTLITNSIQIILQFYLKKTSKNLHTPRKSINFALANENDKQNDSSVENDGVIAQLVEQRT
ncbi:MAG: hypothetical protein J6C81_04880, partial [Muribaculaceae bacterium]|nr:hypothetical protein [Muribaculaceae bacterium]